MWRYAPALPVQHETSIITLGEGMTPLLPARRTGARIGAADLLIKDEGSESDRIVQGARAVLRGLDVRGTRDRGSSRPPRPATPPARWRLMPRRPASRRTSSCRDDVPQANFIECKAYGAHVTLVDGLISDCAKIVAERGPKEGWFDLSHPERALPHRRQEDDGVRGRRTTRMGTAGRDFLSDGRRSRA